MTGLTIAKLVDAAFRRVLLAALSFAALSSSAASPEVAFIRANRPCTIDRYDLTQSGTANNGETWYGSSRVTVSTLRTLKAELAGYTSAWYSYDHDLTSLREDGPKAATLLLADGPTLDVGAITDELHTSASGYGLLYALFTPIEYHVEFDLNGAVGTRSPLTVKYDESFTPAAPVRDGYTFAGWAANGKTYKPGEAISNLTTKDGATVTLAAVWGAETHYLQLKVDQSIEKIHYQVNGGDWLETTVSKSVAVENGQTWKAYLEPVYGYSYSGSGSSKTNPMSETMAAGGAEFPRSSPTKQSYKVTVTAKPAEGCANLIGGGDKTCAYLDVLTLQASAKDGWEFAGWSDGTTDNPYKLEVIQNKELFALFRKEGSATTTFEVIFDANGGTGSMPKQTVTNGVAPTIVNRFKEPTTSAKFLGWATTPTGAILSMSEISKLTKLDGDHVRLYAIWDYNVGDLSKALGCNNLELKCTGGSWEKDESQKDTIKVTSDDMATLFANIIEPGTLTFQWRVDEESALEVVYGPGTDKTTDDCGSKSWTSKKIPLESGASVSFRGTSGAYLCDVRWERKIVGKTVKFNLNGGTRIGGGEEVQTVEVGNPALEPMVTPPTGKVLAGWDKPFDKITGDLTVTAQWKDGEVSGYTVKMTGGLKDETVTVVPENSVMAKAAKQKTTGGKTYACKGWTGTGSFESGKVDAKTPVDGAGNLVVERTIKMDSSITWTYEEVVVPTDPSDPGTGGGDDPSGGGGDDDPPGGGGGGGTDPVVPPVVTPTEDLDLTVGEWVFTEDVTALEGSLQQGVYVFWAVAAAEGATVTVSSLPSGLKYVKKATKDSKLGITIPAGTIYGAPTTAKAYKTKLTVKQGKAKRVYALNLTVAAMSAELIGSYVGGSTSVPTGSATPKLAKTGKVTGKWVTEEGTWTLTSPGFDGFDEGSGVYSATVTAKCKKEVMALSMDFEVRTVEAGETHGEGSVACASCELFDAFFTNWKAAPWKTLATAMKNKTFTVEDSDAVLSAKVGSYGAVTVKTEFDVGAAKPYKASAKGTLVPLGEDLFELFLYYPPKKNKFDGYAVELVLKWNGRELQVED